MKKQSKNHETIMKALIAALTILTVSYCAEAQVKVGYAPIGPHFVDPDCCLNDDINMLSISYKSVGVFSMTNSFNDPSFGFKYEFNGPSKGMLRSSLFAGAVFGYYDSYKFYYGDNDAFYKGDPVVYPFIAPTLYLDIFPWCSYVVSQFGASTVMGVRVSF